jgi:hypothetical protein
MIVYFRKLRDKWLCHLPTEFDESKVGRVFHALFILDLLYYTIEKGSLHR